MRPAITCFMLMSMLSYTPVVTGADDSAKLS